MAAKLAEWQIQNIRDLFAAGHSAAAISRMTGHAQATIAMTIGRLSPEKVYLLRSKPPIAAKKSGKAEPPVASSQAWPDGWFIRAPTMAQLRAGK